MLEVGPGLGVLTRYLAERVAHVHAVELDRSLEPRLRDLPRERRRPLRRRARARPRRARPARGQARREPPVQRRDAARRREPRRPAGGRAVVRDGAARGRRPLLRRAEDEGVRRRLGARPARRASAPASTPSRARSSGRRRTSTPRSSPSGASTLPRDFARVKRVVEAAFAHRRKTLPNSLALAGRRDAGGGRASARRDRPRADRAAPRSSSRPSSSRSRRRCA